MKLYASIYIGSYEVVMKLFQTKKYEKPKELNCMRHAVRVIYDIFDNGEVSLQTTEEICRILSDMKSTMETYKIKDYTLAIGNTVHVASNEIFLLEQIKLKTGMIPVRLSNSEQRFYEYEAVAGGEYFENVIKNSAVMVDIGGSSLQLTFFRNGSIVTTQHLDLGTFNMHKTMQKLKAVPNGKEQIDAVIDKELETFLNMFLDEDKIEYLIIIADRNIPTEKKTGEDQKIIFEKKEFRNIIEKEWNKNVFVEDTFTGSLERSLFILMREIIEMLPAEEVVVPNTSINDGMALDYLYKNKFLVSDHDFEKDIINASWAIAKRYESYFPHLTTLEKLSVKIFDGMKRYHGMDDRDRLLLEVAVILHDCGKYISLNEASKCSNRIILSSEILGLSHKERQMIAAIAEYNRLEIPPYRELSGRFSATEYWTVVKLVAILKVANALDRSHKQKLKKADIHIRKNELIIAVGSESSIALERGLFTEKADFFEKVFNIRPVIREEKR
jgi:exopolyphosphatase/guanosine-5'-triphosphate,3'-diphosphate pyrophosphatase